MDKRYICYCGLYCENCATKARVEPAAKVLFEELKRAGFEEIMPFLPGGDGFWPFLKNMAEDGTCDSCKEGSGNPGCRVRVCAQGKDVEMCALCDQYPCALIDAFDEGYPILKRDNALLRDKGIDAWGKLQDERRASGFTYSDERAGRTPMKKRHVSPFLSFTGRAEEAMNFYASILPGAEITKFVRYGKGHPYAKEGEENNVLHGELSFMGREIMFLDMDAAHPAPVFNWAASLYINCCDEAEFDAIFAGLSQDGTVMMGPEAVGSFRKCAWVTDKFGVTWQPVWE